MDGFLKGIQQRTQAEESLGIKPEVQHTTHNTQPEVPEGYKLVSTEVKSKRVQLVFKPSTYAKAKAKAEAQGISLNEYMHKLIEVDN